jgi:hypothetical protein
MSAAAAQPMMGMTRRAGLAAGADRRRAECIIVSGT